MASLHVDFFKSSMIIFLCIFPFMLLHVTCTEFAIGDTNGWKVPPSKDPQVYNEWAQKNRFKVNDTLQFKYKKDSVMVVTEEEYEKCQSPKPLFFSNNGDTAFLLDRPGLHYFMSGVTGHCQRGQKMIVKVLDVVDNNPPDDQQSGNTTPDNENKKNGATQFMMMGVASSPTLLLLMILGFVVIAY